MKFNHLISEDGKNTSIGRVLLWPIFILLCVFWTKQYVQSDTHVIIPESLNYAFYSLLLYNTGKKARDVLHKKTAPVVLHEEEGA